MLSLLHDLFQGLAVAGGGAGAAEGSFRLGPDDGDRGPKLVGGVGGKLALALKSLLQPV